MDYLNETNKADISNALFHYTTANGLLGILQSGCLWSTAYYCMNDSAELTLAKKFLLEIFNKEISILKESKDPVLEFLNKKNMDSYEAADVYSGFIVDNIGDLLETYLTCFYRPTSLDAFHHGLLSQWRGYGSDGGYAIQFNRNNLEKFLENIENNGVLYDFDNVSYEEDLIHKSMILDYEENLSDSFKLFLERLSENNMQDALLTIKDLDIHVIMSIHSFNVFTKNKHFKEESEFRMVMNVLSGINSFDSSDQTKKFYCREGLIVPYIETPSSLDLLSCIDKIIVGPSPRIDERVKSVLHLVKSLSLNIDVVKSDIPYIRS